MPVYGELVSSRITDDSETALFEPNRAGEPDCTRLVHQQQQVLTFLVAGSVEAIANVPNELPECVSRRRPALQGFFHLQGYNNRLEVRKFRMRLELRARHKTAHDKVCPVSEFC